ncbi:MAG: hypothetical protein KME26_16960 [Oscillatoria princeps RMCB-10]|jgi:hypothetical protein|nr:hypothetical protein [Oscillatoria princeps RMCB-10]
MLLPIGCTSACFNPVSGIQLAKDILLLQPAEIIVALIWACLHNRDAPSLITQIRRSLPKAIESLQRRDMSRLYIYRRHVASID